MNANINCTLKGQYKVDIYSGSNLMETTDWFSNDITNYGMTYPFDYSFAQCFMFLSIGNAIHGTLNNNPNTGLASPIKSFKVYNPFSGYFRQSGEYIGWPGYEIGDTHTQNYTFRVSSCGSKITKNGINLYRGWSIPTGNAEFSTVIGESNGLLIRQLMVSPSSGSDVKGNKAFSLVDRDILIPSGYNAIITYQLSINFKDYENIQFFSGKNIEGTNGYFNTGNAEIGKNGSELNLLSGWSNLSGIYRLIFPAIQFVDDIGACVSPKIGYDLEPYTINTKQTHFYLSPDISNFMVSNSGKIPSSEYEAYNSIGLMGNYTDLYNDITIYSFTTTATEAFGDESDKWFYSGESLKRINNTPEFLLNQNIRLNQIPSISNYNSGYLQNFNYKTHSYIGAKNFPVAFATPGRFGFNDSLSDFGQKAVFSTYLRRMPINPILYQTGFGPYQRNKYVTKKATFPSLHSYGHNSRYGSLVLARSSSLQSLFDSNFYPYLDFLFFDDEGRASNMAHYRYIPYIYLQERGSGIGRAIFSITGENGEKPSSINRIFSATGFMGNGISTSFNQSGINIDHPMLNPLIATITDTNDTFIPGGDKVSGYLFPGQTLNENVKGNVNYNNNIGYGSVYGIIANRNFYLNDYDVCLLDKPDWTGFGIPNPTGYKSRLCWPYHKNKIGLKIDVGYFLSGLGIIEDPNNYFADGSKQIIDDIVVRGNHSFNEKSFLSPLVNNAFCLSGIGDSKKLLFSEAINQNFKFRVSGNNQNFDIKIIVKSGLAGNETGVFFSGFPSGFSLAERGSGSNMDFGSVVYPVKVLGTGDFFGLPKTETNNPNIDISLGATYKFYTENNGLSKFALYGYKYQYGQLLVSPPTFYEIEYTHPPELSSYYKINFNWITGQYDGYFVLIHDLPALGIQSLNLKSGINIPANLNVSNFEIGNTGDSYVEGVGYLTNFDSIYNNYLNKPFGFVDKEYALIGDCSSPATTYSGLLYVIPTNFKKPIGHIYHLESGYRMSPNYSIANTGKINTYLPITGGSFPGLSTENALDIYLTLNWKSE